MTRCIIFTFCVVTSASAWGQRNYAEALRQGNNAFAGGQYKAAINKYFAAEAFDPSKKDLVKIKVNLVFDRIEKLRVDAERAQKEIQKAKTAADTAKNNAVRSAEQAQVALEKAEKLIGTFYFYKDRFALAYKSPGVSRAGITRFYFYYIDKNGNAIEKLGTWDEAGPFNESGFAKVRKEYGGYKLGDYVIDTAGTEYRTAYDTTAIDSSIVSLDLSEKKWVNLPPELFGYHHLQVLVFSGSHFMKKNIFTLTDSIGQLKELANLQMAFCNIDSLPAGIGELQKLVTLNLSDNNLKSLPSQTGNLKNLEILDLTNNQLTSLPVQIGQMKKLKSLLVTRNKIPESDIDKIKKLLPNCNIVR